MTKVDIISGFLGAGKTTLIKKLIAEVFAGQQIVLIENEFGEIGIDGGFLKDAGINITEMNSGCICCSLVGDFATALKKVVDEYHPDRIIIEPSGVGKLSDVERAVLDVADEAGIEIATATTVVDAKKAKMYMKNFGEFFNNQVETARCVVLSRTQDVTADKLDETVKLIREKNHEAAVITTPWDEIEGSVIFGAMSDAKALEHERHLSTSWSLNMTMSIITTIITMMMTRNVSADIITTMMITTMTTMIMSMSTIMTTNTSTITTIIMIMTRTRYLQAGALRHRRSLTELTLRRSLTGWQIPGNSDRFSVPRESFSPLTESGCTLTLRPERAR